MGSNPTQCNFTEPKKMMQKKVGSPDARPKCWMAIVVHGEQATRNVASTWLYTYEQATVVHMVNNKT